MILSSNNIIFVIVVIIALVLFFGILIGSYIYKVKHKIPVGECAGCANKMKRAINKAKKDLSKEHQCACKNKDK